MSKSRNRTYCCVFGCINNNSARPDLSMFSVPMPNNPERRLEWLRLIGREDLFEATYANRVCEEHFKPDEILMKSTRKILKRNAVPTLKLPLENDIENYTRWKLMGGPIRVKHDVVPHIFKCQTKEKLGKREKIDCKQTMFWPEIPLVETTEDQASPEEVLEVNIKEEIEDSFSEHEEDVMEQLENRKRMSQILEHVPAKMKKVDPSVPMVEVEREYSNAHKVVQFPVDFMKTVLNSQNEILTVLKSQVLLQDPDTDLIKFLRLLGAKLQRLEPAKRREVQNAVLDLVNSSGFYVNL